MERTGEGQFLAPEKVLQAVGELSAKDFAEHLHRQKEAAIARGESPGRHYALSYPTKLALVLRLPNNIPHLQKETGTNLGRRLEVIQIVSSQRGLPSEVHHEDY